MDATEPAQIQLSPERGNAPRDDRIPRDWFNRVGRTGPGDRVQADQTSVRFGSPRNRFKLVAWVTQTWFLQLEVGVGVFMLSSQLVCGGVGADVQFNKVSHSPERQRQRDPQSFFYAEEKDRIREQIHSSVSLD